MKKPNKNKGFSLVELIIVIAIMVALIAVMAPTFTKYIAKSREAVMVQSAEMVLSFVKTEYTSGDLTGKGTIRVCSDADGIVRVMVLKAGNTLCYKNGTELDDFAAACGISENKKCKTNLAYDIKIDNTISSHPEISLTSSTDGYKNFDKAANYTVLNDG